MTDRTRILIGRSMAGVGMGSALVGWIWVLALHGPGVLWDEWLLHNGAAAIGFGLIAWIVLPHQPRNGAIWTSAVVALTTGLFCLSLAASLQMAGNYGFTLETLLQAAPADFPLLPALVPMMASWLYIPLLLAFTVGLLLFPDGRPPSPRWRWAIWASIGGVILSSLGFMWLFRPSGMVPYSGAFSTLADNYRHGPLIAIGETVNPLMVPVCVAAMIVRFRKSSGVERQQFRLVVWGAAVAGGLILLMLGADAIGGVDPRWPLFVALVILISSYGVAIGKYRLYDIDVVISRTFVYVTLAVFITAVYVGIVVGVGLLFGTQDEPNVWLGIVATVVIAIAFQPLRRRLQKVANRLVYGRRATPYEVLSSFSQGVAAVDPDVLEQVAESLTEGTTATGAVIWVQREQILHRIAFWPQAAEMPFEVPVGSAIPGADRMAEITHGGERLGMISLTLPAGQPFPPTDEQLLEQVTAGLGLALRNLLLTDDLRRRVDQLRESRRRIVAVQDQTRQGLERDLHDGAQQRLVALKIKVGISASMSEKEGLDDVKQILDNVKDETDLTIDSLRTLARGIYPPLLDAEGLGPALTTQLHRMAFPITVQAAGIGRHPRELEATVYFCVLEAVQNSIKHAQANSVLVTLSDEEGFLTFEVRDDGVGFDIDQPTGGHGLINITDRLDAVEGTLQIDSRPGHGTLIRGRIPVLEGALA